MRSHKGFTVVHVILAVLAVVLVGGGLLMITGSGRLRPNDGGLSHSSPKVPWQHEQDGWKVVGKAPACHDPIALTPPADLTKVTAILYPGQTRGGNYKPHGGLRFDTITDNSVEVTTPIEGAVVRGARYLVDGETQYTFDLINNCGIMIRLGHLLVLTPDFQKIADRFEPAQEGDSRTTNINPPIEFPVGTKIATKVGTSHGTANTFFDWGVYDLRTKNAASQDPTWAAAHGDDTELAPHAVCWFDWFSVSDETIVRGLPAGDPTSGKNSDYCKN